MECGMLPHWKVILYTIPTLCSSPTVRLPLPAHCPMVPWQCCTVSPSLTSTSIDASGWSVECCHIGGSFCTQFSPSAHRPLFACHYPLIALMVPWQCCTVSPSLTSTSIDASGWSVECCHIGGSFCPQFKPSAHRPLIGCHYLLIAQWSPGSVVQSPPH